MNRLVGSLFVVCLLVTSAAKGDDDFLERFALSEDRAAVLSELIPGTEDYYYFHSLHFQSTDQLDDVDALLELWIERYNQTAQVREIQNRQALLRYGSNPQQTLEHLRRTLGLRFDHQRQIAGQQSNHPTALNQQHISRSTLIERALAVNNDTMNGFEQSGLDLVHPNQLNDRRRRHLLNRLRLPDYPQLVRLIDEDLSAPNSSGFGHMEIHRALLVSQLDELLGRRPNLLNDRNFVQIYLTKLRVSPDVDWRHDAAAREAYFERLDAFASRLNPSFNSLKASVIYHRLVHDRARGEYNRALFIRYLQLPRTVPYMKPEFIRTGQRNGTLVDLNRNFESWTQLPIIGPDEPIVRSYLAHFFSTADAYTPFEPYLNENYLREVFAETKILNGEGDMEQWYSWLPAGGHQFLKDRIDLDFAHTNREFFDLDDSVSLDLWVKNVETLIVKIFEVNTKSYYQRHQKEVNTDIDLDGLMANREQTFTYEEPPLRRVLRHFEFPELDHRGIYVIDFIGSGKSSRAVLRKGRLRFIERAGAAGHVFTVLDEAGDVVTNASITLGARDYEADDDGAIRVPLSGDPGRQPIILSSGSFSSLNFFEHQGESYSFTAGIHVDRESLRKRRAATVAIRPALYLGGTPVSLGLLEEVALVITSVDREGVASTQEVPDFPLYEDRESIYTFRVPDNLAHLSFSLRAKVENISQSKKVDVAVSKSFELNQVDRGEKIQAVHLSRINGKYILELFGKTGEANEGRPLQVMLKNKNFVQPVYVVLQSDAEGRIDLGALEDIVTVAVQDRANGQTIDPRSWELVRDQHSYPRSVQSIVGDPIRIAYMGAENNPDRSGFALIEIRGNTYYQDRLDALRLDEGFAVIEGLPAGDYELHLKDAYEAIRIRVTDGSEKEGYVISDYRQLEVENPTPLQIVEIDARRNNIRVQLANHSEFSRVHVVATRFIPAYSFYNNMSAVVFAEPSQMTVPRAQNQFISGRNIGDEYRYILERQYARTFPGNMLGRPELLIAPWALRDTQTDLQRAAEGEAPRASAPPATTTAAREAAEAAAAAGTADYANLDFLDGDAVVFLNLEVNEDGILSIPRENLGGRQQIHVVAIDPLNTVYREVSLAEGDIDFIDLRLPAAIDPEIHTAERKQTTALDAGEQLVLTNAGASRFEVYDSLAGVFKLFQTLTPDPNLVEFNFVTRWPSLSNEEKRTLYSKFASHELNFFLLKKDPEFFEVVVRPFVQNKLHKTFLDHWLLNDPLGEYMRPWAHAQLNIVERILLAERIEAERSNTAGHVVDLYNLLPPNTDRLDHLFTTALHGSALGLRTAGAMFGFSADSFGSAPTRGGAGGVGLRRMEAGNEVVTYEIEMDSAAPAEALGQLGERFEESIASKKALAADMRVRDMADDKEGGRFFADDEMARLGVRQLYQKLDTTKEWVENNYYHLPIEQQNAALVSVNSFWRDYAERDPEAPFFSTHFLEASRNFPEMLLALAVLDLPFEPEEHSRELEEQQFVLEAASRAIVFHKEIQRIEASETETPILVSQNFFRHGDRYRQVNNERVDKFVTDEFLVNVVYGCQVVVTNPTSSRQKLDVLLQIPQGALPVLNGKYLRSARLDLQPYNTATLKYYFYFPGQGNFDHYPVHIAKDGELIAFVDAATMNVLLKPSTVDTTSWAYISQNGTEGQVLSYLTDNNAHQVSLEQIAWRMRDRAFFEQVVALLTKQHIFNATLWSYGIQHNDVASARAFLQHRNDVVSQCGRFIDTPLLTIDPVVRKTYQHMEYSPLVNARAHKLGPVRKILNDRFAAQHRNLMSILAYHEGLRQEDLMAVTYYMLLQDRVEEALSFFNRVEPTEIPTRIQYDYMDAYLAFYLEDTTRAGEIAARYEGYPVERWDKVFATVRDQLAEIAGASGSVVDDQSHTQRQTALASTEPGFDFEVTGNQVTVTYQNLEDIQVHYYLMDIELLFSRNPFVQQESDHFLTVLPNHSETKALEVGGTSYTFDLPAQFHNSNVMLEITAGGLRTAKAHFSHSLGLQVIGSYGQVRVTRDETGAALSKVYVKVFARMKNGEVKFYKDGYTDLRGRFDYTSLNTNELDFVDRFALLVMSDENGAVVREVAPPQR